MEAMIKNATNRGINEVIRLGDVCEINNGKNITESQFIEGKYPVIGGGRNYIGYHNEFNAPENTITISKAGNTCGYVKINKNKVFVTNNGMYISKIYDNLKISYLYNYLKLIKNIIFTYGRGTAQPALYENDLLNKIIILVPPLEYQNKMEHTLNNFDGLDEGFNNMLREIENNYKTAFLNSLDDYGNPNSFNIDKLIELNDEIKKI